MLYNAGLSVQVQRSFCCIHRRQGLLKHQTEFFSSFPRVLDHWALHIPLKDSMRSSICSRHQAFHQGPGDRLAEDSVQTLAHVPSRELAFVAGIWGSQREVWILPSHLHTCLYLLRLTQLFLLSERQSP